MSQALIKMSGTNEGSIAIIYGYNDGLPAHRSVISHGLWRTGQGGDYCVVAGRAAELSAISLSHKQGGSLCPRVYPVPLGSSSGLMCALWGLPLYPSLARSPRAELREAKIFLLPHTYLLPLACSLRE